VSMNPEYPPHQSVPARCRPWSTAPRAVRRSRPMYTPRPTEHRTRALAPAPARPYTPSTTPLARVLLCHLIGARTDRGTLPAPGERYDRRQDHRPLELSRTAPSAYFKRSAAHRVRARRSRLAARPTGPRLLPISCSATSQTWLDDIDGSRPIGRARRAGARVSAIMLISPSPPSSDERTTLLCRTP